MDERNIEDRHFRIMKEDYPEPERQQRGPEHRYDFAFPAISLAVCVSVWLGLDSTLPGGGLSRNVLVVFVALVAGGLSFIANKAAFHQGAKLAARGYKYAIALVMTWFAIMGITVGTIGFAGVSHEIVEDARLREPAKCMADAARSVGEAASQERRILPLFIGGKSDISDIAQQELRRGLVSGRAGPGPMVDRLNALARRFAEVERAYQTAERPRAALVGKLETLVAKYEEQLSKGGATGSNRAKLVAIYAQAQTLVTEIANVVPTTAARALVGELRSTAAPAAIPGGIDVGERLRGHADRLEQALEQVPAAKVALPPFPAPAGLMVGWQRLDLTAPLAVLLFGLEAILVILWLLQVVDFRARIPSARLRGIDPDAPGPSSPAVPDPVQPSAPERGERVRLNGHDELPFEDDDIRPRQSRPRRG